MKLLRLPLKKDAYNKPKLDTLDIFSGIYGIEFLFLDKELHQLLLINDKVVRKAKTGLIDNDLFIYLNSFGLSIEDIVKVEYMDIDILNSKDIALLNPVALYFDFENSSSIHFIRAEEQLKGDYITKTKYLSQDLPNFFKHLLSYLLGSTHNFIVQLYFSSKNKTNSFIGGQLCLFGNHELGRVYTRSIYRQLESVLIKFLIYIKRPKFPLYKTNRIVNAIKEHYPFKWYSKPVHLINYYFTIPFSFLSNYPNLEWKYNYNTRNNNNNSLESIDIDEDGVPLGFQVIPGLKNPPIVNLSMESLTSHFSCFGLTSQGKSRLMYNFLSIINQTEKKFLVVDTKGEYYLALRHLPNPITYLEVGSREYPVTINIFEVPKGFPDSYHELFLNSLLTGIMGDEISPQMGKILFHSIKFIINRKASFVEFIKILENPKILNLKGSYLEMSGAAILNRLLPLITGPGKYCFLSQKTNINFQKLTQTNVILDLSQFEIIESTISRKIFVNTFLNYYLHAIRYSKDKIRDKGNISTFIILEEIQKIAPLTYQGRNEINSFIGMAPWTVRAYGVCLGFIGTEINVETPILTNTGINIFFYSKSNYDKICKILGINYSDLLLCFSKIKERRRFVLSIKGDLKIVESFEYSIPNSDQFNKHSKIP